MARIRRQGITFGCSAGPGNCSWRGVGSDQVRGGEVWNREFQGTWRAVRPIKQPRMCSRTLVGCSDPPSVFSRSSTPPVFSRGGSLLPSIHADGGSSDRYRYAVAALLKRQGGGQTAEMQSSSAGGEAASSAADLSKQTFSTASDGNHGVAVAWVARRFGASARVYLHAGVSAERFAAIAKLGAAAVRAGSNYEESIGICKAESKAKGYTVVQDVSWSVICAICLFDRLDYGGTWGGSSGSSLPPVTSFPCSFSLKKCESDRRELNARVLPSRLHGVQLTASESVFDDLCVYADVRLRVRRRPRFIVLGLGTKRYRGTYVQGTHWWCRRS